MSVVAIAIWVLILLAGLFGLHAWAVHWTRAVETADQPLPDKVHRLQRAMLAAAFSVVPGVVAVNIVLRSSHPAHHGRPDTSLLVVAGLLFVGVVLGPPLAAGRPIRAGIARLREVDLKPEGRGRQALVGIAIGTVLGLIGGLVGAALPRHGAAAALIRIAALGLLVMLAQLLVAPLLLVALRARRLPPECEQRFQRLASQLGVRVRGFRELPARRQRQANALQVGGLPGVRYIAITDYLLDNFDPEQADAIVAHELGHAAHHHLLKKAGAWLLTWAGLQALLLVPLRSVRSPSLLAASPLLLVAALLVVHGVLGVRLEQQADDVASRLVGAQPMIGALERLGDLNHAKRSTSRAWNLLTQHPGLDQRIARARDLAAQPLAGDVSVPRPSKPPRTATAGQPPAVSGSSPHPRWPGSRPRRCSHPCRARP
jgi:STE24 endopeptidase